MRLEGSSPYCHLALGPGDLSGGQGGAVEVIGGNEKKRAPLTVVLRVYCRG